MIVLVITGLAVGCLCVIWRFEEAADRTRRARGDLRE